MQKYVVEDMEQENNGDAPNIVSSMALDKLLEWDGDLHVTDKVHIERLGIDLQIRAVGMEELEKYNSQSETVSRSRGRGTIERDTDNVKLGRLLVFNCVENPDLNDEQLQEKHNSPNGKRRHPTLIVNALFLPGETKKIQDAILTLSGFLEGEFVIDDETSENLS